MTVFTAITTTATKSAADALGEALEALDPAPYGLGIFEVEDGSNTWEIGAYFTDAPDDTELALLAAAFEAKPFALSEVGDRDWVADVRRELPPVHAGRFLVHGSHDRDAAANARYPLEIEAAMAFGTGHHGTTRGCLIALDRLARRGVHARRVADIGCGTGVLAMAAAALWHLPVVASDIDQVAVDTARANMRANRLGSLARLVRAAGFEAPGVRGGGPYDLVFANILARPLRRLAPAMARSTAPGGYIILSGILNDQAAGVEAVYRAHGFMRDIITRDGEWSTLTLRKMKKGRLDGRP